MKKIPTLFERKFADHKVVGITPNVTPGCEASLEEGKCVATVKWDGSCCAIVGKTRGFYKRYDAKKGKTPPEGAIRSCTIVLNNGEIARVKAGTKEVKVKRSKTISAEL